MKTHSKFLAALIIGLSFLAYSSPASIAGEWEGTDATIVEKAAVEAGREPRAPLINTDQGDILLFVFLLAGTAGGFVGGYYYHKLFALPTENQDNAS